MLNQVYQRITTLGTVGPTGLTSIAEAGVDTDIPCSFQPDQASEVVAQNIQEGRVSGRLYYPESETLSIDDLVLHDSKTWNVVGPSVRAPGNPYRWVPISRSYRNG